MTSGSRYSSGQLEQRRPKLGDILILRGGQHRLLSGDQFIDVHGHEALALEGAGVLPANDRQEPRLGGRFVQQRILRLPSAQHRFLNHILRKRPVAGQPKCEAQQIRTKRLAKGLEAVALQISANLVVHV